MIPAELNQLPGNSPHGRFEITKNASSTCTIPAAAAAAAAAAAYFTTALVFYKKLEKNTPTVRPTELVHIKFVTKHALCRLAVSYTHLTLPTIYSV